MTHHLEHYGHPSRTGFIDIIGKWKAEHWDPAYLLDRYRKAGARYFMAMACHHDNLDLFDSRHHAWNSLRVGPKRDIVGTWEKLVRQTDLKFAVSNHSSHAWHWWQTAYGYDAEGPMRGRRYDAYWLRAKDGRGTFWDGLDPQELYTGPTYVPPDGLTSDEAMNAWHDARDGQWLEDVPPQPAGVRRQMAARQMDLVEKYRPDMVYFDDYQASVRAARARRGRAISIGAAPQWHGEMGVRHRQAADAAAEAERSSRMSSAASLPTSSRSRGRPTPASATGITTGRSMTATATRADAR